MEDSRRWNRTACEGVSMYDRHKYYPEAGWYWKWVIATVIMVMAIALMVCKIKEALYE